MTTARESGTKPILSVVVPVYNDPRGIRETLESVTAQTYPAEAYEILAVDNGSTDGTREVIRAFESFHDTVRLLVEDEIQGSYAARNEGIEHARGEIVSFVDADMTVEEDWAESIVASYEEHGWDYMGCPVELYVERETLTATYDRTLGGFPVEQYMRERNFTGTGSLSVRREVFDAVGRFDERIVSQGDGEFGKRVAEAGFDQHFEPEITMYHAARSDLRAWLRKQVRIGRGAIQKQVYYPERTEGAERVHPLHPRKFLPPNPLGFYERLTAREARPSGREIAGLYAIDSLSKLARTGGGILEWIEQSRAGNRPAGGRP
ncbi:glycosyltransferase [Natrononativus amylolyticus]|uniref:glycosyltransferase n=1 Tax=Natrononativus amylolyticus TaxID=2963434 RepID=UPI0020CB704C|nr:glycosyltransferase [Natrononativus amylolyticus]